MIYEPPERGKQPYISSQKDVRLSYKRILLMLKGEVERDSEKT